MGLATTERTSAPVMGDRELAEHEAVIERGRQTFLDVGHALMAIHDGRGYQTAGFDTFEAYCRERWDFQANYARKLMRAAEFVDDLISDGTTVPLPETEREARRMMSEPKVKAVSLFSFRVPDQPATVIAHDVPDDQVRRQIEMAEYAKAWLDDFVSVLRERAR